MMETEKQKWVDDLLNHKISPPKNFNQEQKSKIIQLLFTDKKGYSILKFAVITLLLLFTFNVISARHYYQTKTSSMEQSVYKLYFESINQ